MDNLPQGLLGKAASVYEHLRRLATRGQLRPERRLSPSDLAAELRISVTPVRDALARLASEGFIVGAPGRGYFTRGYVTGEQYDLNVLLCALLLISLDLAGGANASLKTALAKAMEAVGDEDDPPEPQGRRFTDAVDAFVVELGAASGNAPLLDLLRNLIDRSRYVRELAHRGLAGRSRTAELLHALVERVPAGDMVEAAAITRGHLARFKDELPDLIAVANRAAWQLKFP